MGSCLFLEGSLSASFEAFPVFLVVSWFYVLRLNAFRVASNTNMASLRNKMSRWMLRSSEGLDASTAKDRSNNSSLDAERGSLDSGYYTLRSLENQDSVPLDRKDSPKTVSRRLHKAISTTFVYLSETVRSGATYMYEEPTIEEDPALEWSELESQTPRKHLKRRSSLFPSMRRRKTQPNSPKTDAPQDPVDATPTRRIVNDEAPTLDGVEIPDPELDEEKTVSAGAAARVFTRLWPNPVRVAVSDVSPIPTYTHDPVLPSMEDPYIDSPYLSTERPSSGRRLSFISSALPPSPSPEPGKGYLSDERGYYAEVESNPEQSESDSSSAGPKGRPSKLLSSASLMRATSYKPDLADLPTLPASHMKLDKGTISEGLLTDAYGGDGEFSDGSPPNMGPRAVWEQRKAARRQRYLALHPLESTNTLSDDGFEPSLQLKRSPGKTSFRQPRQSDTLSPGGLRLAVEAIDSKSGLEYNLNENTPGIGPTGVDPFEATEATEDKAQSPVNLVFRKLGVRDDPKALDPEARSEIEQVGDLRLAVEAIDSKSGLEYNSDENTPGTCLSNVDSFEATDSAEVESQSPVNLVFPEKLIRDDLTALDPEADSQIEPVGQQLCRSDSPSLTAESLQGEELQANLDLKTTPSPLVNAASPTALFSRPRLVAAFKHTREESGSSDITDKDCALSTQDLQSHPSPFPILHVRSSPAVADPEIIEAVRTYEDGEIPICGPNNMGFSPSKSRASPAHEIVVDPPRVDCSPQTRVASVSFDDRPFMGAALPYRPKVAPNMKRTPMGDISENARSVSNPSTPDAKPKISIAQFSPKTAAPTEYAGHELDFEQPTANENQGRSPRSNSKRCGCFEPKTEITKPAASPTRKKSKNSKKKKASKKGMEAKQELPPPKLPEFLKSAKEKTDASEPEKVGALEGRIDALEAEVKDWQDLLQEE